MPNLTLVLYGDNIVQKIVWYNVFVIFNTVDSTILSYTAKFCSFLDTMCVRHLYEYEFAIIPAARQSADKMK